MTRSEPIEATTEVTATRARQGRLGRDVFWVLLISTLLALGALLAAWAWHAESLSATEPAPAQEAAAARTFDVPAP